MSIRARLERAEQRLGQAAAGFCQCPGGGGLYWDDGEPALPFCPDGQQVAQGPPAQVCAVCGKPCESIRLVWEDSDVASERE